MYLRCGGRSTFWIEMVNIGPAIQKCGVVPILFGGRLEINWHTIIGIENTARNFFTLNMLIQFFNQLKNTALLFMEQVLLFCNLSEEMQILFFEGFPILSSCTSENSIKFLLDFLFLRLNLLNFGFLFQNGFFQL